MTRRHILPPSSSALERSWDETLPAWEVLADAFKTPSEGESPVFLPWCAAEYGLAEFAPYFDSVPALLAEGQPWLFLRGTAAGVALALRWVGFDNAVIEESGARLHINLGRTATAAEISRIAHVVRATVPAHVQFWRVFWGLDRRTLRLDRGQPLDTGLLDDDSGVWISVATGEPVKASFGNTHRGTTTTSAAGEPLTAAEARHVARLTRNDKPVLDCWRLDSRLLANESGGLGELMRIEANAYLRVQGEGVAPGVLTLGEGAWSAPTAEGAGTSWAADELPPALPQPRRWAGTWGSRSWRPVFIESLATEST